MKTKHHCTLGLLFFVISYLLFSKLLPDFQDPIDFAHWFNLIGACLLLSFNDVFPKNRLNSIASVVTALGVIAHIGLCTIDFIMSGFGNDDFSREELSQHISNVPSILYSFVIVGPSLLFIGLSLHALNFIKTNTVSFLMVFISSLAIGFSFFILKNGVYMLLSCVIFVLGLGLLLFRKEENGLVSK
jgi:ABC-type multidrug transport system permease subunit